MILGIIGYGKMGKKIEQLALAKNYTIGFKINSQNPHDLNIKNIKNIDVVIEFSEPKIAFKNIAFCIKQNTPVVSGTTGWLDQLDEIHKLCKKYKGTFLHSDNFSMGVNIFLREILNIFETINLTDYSVRIEETHHKEKKDSPSGTALMIVKKIKEKIKEKIYLPINSKRINNITGEHKILFESLEDVITISHKAKNRNCFAKGAILAAEFIRFKKGVFTMQNLIDNI